MAAQDQSSIVIGNPEIEAFPNVRFQLTASDGSASFMNTLKPQDLTILEDGQARKAASLDKKQVGLQIILALNTGPSLSNQPTGISEYQRLQAALIDWARGQSAQTADDFSLSTPTGLFSIRERDSQQLVKALSEYKPDLTKAQPSPGSLAEALDLATDPLGRPDMKRVILFITPPLPASASATLEDLTGRAAKTGAQVHVWQMVAGASPDAAKANPLQKLAETTGGQYAEITPGAPFPEIEPLFQPLRYTYEVQYESAIQKGGQHTLQVNLSSAQAKGSSNEVSFRLDIQPPNPIFLSPPATIQRYWATPEGSSTPALNPENVLLQILVEFPDQHPRDLKATRLYVNDRLVQENTSAPFDRFTWPLADLNTPSRQTLRVEAVDLLGLSGSSIETPIEILVDQPAKASLSERVSSQGIIAVVSVAAAGGILALVLLLTRTRHKAGKTDKKRQKDPLTQPVAIAQDRARAAKSAPARLPPTPSKPARTNNAWSAAVWNRSGAQNAPARLVALDENEQPITGGAILLTRQEITFGTDPRRATQVIESPTVNELHARLYRDTEDCFFLADQNSIAGTWINYAPINTSGARLEHGDLIHIGKVMFRFELADPTRSVPVEIKVIELEQ